MTTFEHSAFFKFNSNILRLEEYLKMLLIRRKSSRREKGRDSLMGFGDLKVEFRLFLGNLELKLVFFKMVRNALSIKTLNSNI